MNDLGKRVLGLFLGLGMVLVSSAPALAEGLEKKFSVLPFYEYNKFKIKSQKLKTQS